MPAPRAEIGDAQPVNRTQAGDLFPQLGHCAGIKHFQLKPPQPLQHSPPAQFHQHGKGGDLPQHHFVPRAFKGQLILAITLFQVIGRKAKAFEPFHEIGAKHLALAVKHIAAQPSAFPARQRKGAHMIQLLAQLALIHQIGKADFRAAVDQAEFHRGVAAVAKDGLAHQQLVKVGVDQRPHNGVNFPAVVPHPCRKINHCSAPYRADYASKRAERSKGHRSLRPDNLVQFTPAQRPPLPSPFVGAPKNRQDQSRGRHLAAPSRQSPVPPHQGLKTPRSNRSQAPPVSVP